MRVLHHLLGRVTHFVISLTGFLIVVLLRLGYDYIERAFFFDQDCLFPGESGKRLLLLTVIFSIRLPIKMFNFVIRVMITSACTELMLLLVLLVDLLLLLR